MLAALSHAAARIPLGSDSLKEYSVLGKGLRAADKPPPPSPLPKTELLSKKITNNVKFRYSVCGYSIVCGGLARHVCYIHSCQTVEKSGGGGMGETMGGRLRCSRHVFSLSLSLAVSREKQRDVTFPSPTCVSTAYTHRYICTRTAL